MSDKPRNAHTPLEVAEAQFHDAIKPFASKRDQGRIMGEFRRVMAATFGTPGLEVRDPALCNYPALPRLASVRREVGMGMEELLLRFEGWADPGSVFQAVAHPDQRAPLDMVLYCPCCGAQHIDEPEERIEVAAPDGEVGFDMEGWQNPPHRSHLCKYCGNVWRPADVATNGVAATKTKGQRDTWDPERLPKLLAGHGVAEHAAQVCEEVADASRNSLFRSAAKICAGEIRRSPGHVTANAAACKWNYDMSTCPVGAKVQLLNLGGVACYGPVTERDRRYFAAWAPLMQRDKEEEKRRGLHI